jgi:hypothetical protein
MTRAELITRLQELDAVIRFEPKARGRAALEAECVAGLVEHGPVEINGVVFRAEGGRVRRSLPM